MAPYTGAINQPSPRADLPLGSEPRSPQKTLCPPRRMFPIHHETPPLTTLYENSVATSRASPSKKRLKESENPNCVLLNGKKKIVEKFAVCSVINSIYWIYIIWIFHN